MPATGKKIKTSIHAMVLEGCLLSSKTVMIVAMTINR